MKLLLMAGAGKRRGITETHLCGEQTVHQEKIWLGRSLAYGLQFFLFFCILVLDTSYVIHLIWKILRAVVNFLLTLLSAPVEKLLHGIYFFL